MLDKFEKSNRRLSGWIEWIGVAGLLLMMLVTCVDVVGAKLFLWPLPGGLEIVKFSQLVAIALAAAMTLILGKHIRVEFFVARLPRRAQAVIESFVLLLGLALFSMIAWRLCVYGYSLQTAGEMAQTVRIPTYPFAYAIALGSIPVCLVLLQRFIGSLAKVVKR